MRELNSVILEGNLTSDPEYDDTGAVRITLNNNCQPFVVVAKGKLAKKCGELKDGRGIRVVGTIENPGDRFYIYADHMEFKPRKESRA